VEQHADRGAKHEVEQIAAEARRELASAELRLARLHERIANLAASARQEQAELQRFIEEFALQPAITGGLTEQRPGTGPLFNLERVRSGTEELNAEVARSTALQANLAAIVQVLQDGVEQLSGEHAFKLAQPHPDTRFQQAVSAAREEERRRLAREIHDGPAQVLANAVQTVYTVEEVAKRSPEQVVAELQRLREYLRDGTREIRRFMFDLRPAMLEDLGLAPTLRRFTDDYASHFGWEIDVQIDDALPRLTPYQELQLFRIVQESLRNIHRHAGAEPRVCVYLRSVNGQLTLRVTDTGRGFDPTTTVPRWESGAGIPGMRERANAAGGNLTIQSAPGSGTVVEFTLRLPRQSAP
jgi:two-component system sensor histidine kinase DegS